MDYYIKEINYFNELPDNNLFAELRLNLGKSLIFKFGIFVLVNT